MASFTAADVKKLREFTGAGMMDCKKALDEADGDFDKAVEILRVKGAAKAAKRGEEREASSSAFLQSIMPAAVSSRSFLTSAAVKFAMSFFLEVIVNGTVAPPRCRAGPPVKHGAGRLRPSRRPSPRPWPRR